MYKGGETQRSQAQIKEKNKKEAEDQEEEEKEEQGGQEEKGGRDGTADEGRDEGRKKKYQNGREAGKRRHHTHSIAAMGDVSSQIETCVFLDQLICIVSLFVRQ